MNGIIKIVSGLVIGLAGFHQIAQHPVQGISALFLAGFLVMIGFEKEIGRAISGNKKLKTTKGELLLSELARSEALFFHP